MDVGLLGHGSTTMVQLFVDVKALSLLSTLLRREGNISGTLEDFIRQYGAPNSLFSNNAMSQIGKAVREILRMYAIKDFQCEPHHQHQNFTRGKNAYSFRPYWLFTFFMASLCTICCILTQSIIY
jgi:hypothetical protein